MENLKLKKKWCIQSSSSKISDNYDYKEADLLGEGAFGTVFKGTHKITQNTRAIKMVPKSKIKDQERFLREIEILRTVVG